MMPTTVWGHSSTVIVRPRTAGSAPNSLTQRPGEMIAARGPSKAKASSDGSQVRPSKGSTPRVENRDAEVLTATIRCGRSPPVRFTPDAFPAQPAQPMSSKTVFSSR